MLKLIAVDLLEALDVHQIVTDFTVVAAFSGDHVLFGASLEIGKFVVLDLLLCSGCHGSFRVAQHGDVILAATRIP